MTKYGINRTKKVYMPPQGWCFFCFFLKRRLTWRSLTDTGEGLIINEPDWKRVMELK